MTCQSPFLKKYGNKNLHLESWIFSRHSFVVWKIWIIFYILFQANVDRTWNINRHIRKPCYSSRYILLYANNFWKISFLTIGNHKRQINTNLFATQLLSYQSFEIRNFFIKKIFRDTEYSRFTPVCEAEF